MTPLLTAVDRLADQLRALPLSRLSQGAAAHGLALARELAAWAQRIEEPRSAPRTMPDVGIFAVGNQVAVAGHDLAHALGRAPDAPSAGGVRRENESRTAPAGDDTSDERGRAAQIAAAVALVEAAARRCAR